MKKILGLALIALISGTLNAQIVQEDPPYKKLGVLPTMGLLNLDSNAVIMLNTLPKDMPVLVVCFSTTCDHCQAEATDLVKNKDKFKNVRIIFLTPEKLPNIREFYSKYKLAELPNLVIGKDYRFFAPGFYTFKKFPFSVYYNRDHKFITSVEGTSTADMVITEFKKHNALK